MKIALLTSSRADYSIYFPLLKLLKENAFFNVDIIAFGTHNSLLFGETARQIESDGFAVKHKIESLVLGDSPEAIADGMGLTILKFSGLWSSTKYDLCIVLGDRFEMFAAAYSTVPFNIPIAHISGGEQTSGAIDNSFRNAMTVLAKYHFTSTSPYKKRVSEIKGSDENVFNVGALSIDNLKNTELYSVEEFKSKFNIDLGRPCILITCHPETISYHKNEVYIRELINALAAIKDYQLIITMPNADTMGNLIRDQLNNFIKNNSNAIGIESFGTVGYLSCMKYCSFMLGNSSSGFVEASYFPKYVINLGDRQLGRIVTPNIRNCKFDKNEILKAVVEFKTQPEYSKIDTYGDGTAATKIMHVLSSLSK